jgi:hypothetical protein
MYGWLFLLAFDFLLLLFVSFKSSLIFFIFIGIVYTTQMGLFRNFSFTSKIFKNSEIYYVDYIGDYQQIYREFEKFKFLMRKFNLGRHTYSIFGIYYDDPNKVETNKCRAVIGIIKEVNEQKISNKEEDFITYLTNNNFKRGMLPDTESIVAEFKFNNPMSMVVGTQKFYRAIKSSMKSDEFRKKYNIEKSKFKLSIEVYADKKVNFYIPLKNHDKFKLLSN